MSPCVGRARQSTRAVLQKTKAAGSGKPPSGCGFLDQALQRPAHRIVKIGSGEARTAELQLGNKATEENAALICRQTVGGCPDGPKLRIRESEHATMVLPR
jgi:hypothetical protein